MASLESSDCNNTVDISMFFNKYVLIEHPGRRRVAEAIPGILTALGILGTFVGLVAGLNNVDIADNALMKASLQQLMNGLHVAFYTSVYGVLLSIIWTIADRILLERHISKIQEFVQIFRQWVPAIGTNDILKSMLEYNKEQTFSLKHLSTDLALEISKSLAENIVPSMGKTFTDAMDSNLVPSLYKMEKVITNFANIASANQTEGLNNVVDSFIKNMNRSLEGQFDNLAKTISEVCEWQKIVTLDMDMFIKEIKTSTKNQREVNTYAEDIIANITRHMETLNAANDKLLANLDSLGNLSAVISDQSGKNYVLINEVNEKQAAFYKNANSYSESVREQIDRLVASWGQMTFNLKILNENLVNSMKEFSEKTHEGLHTTFGIFDDQLSNIAHRLSSTISEIQDAVDELPGVIIEFKNVMQAVRFVEEAASEEELKG